MDEARDFVDAAVQAALLAGIAVSDACVLYAGSSVIVDLGASGVVARVGGLTAAVRDVVAHYERDVAIARWLAAKSAPIVHPWAPAGPFVHSDKVISFWTRARTDCPARPRQAGAALRRCHESLLSFTGDLPRLESLLEEAQCIVGSITLMTTDRGLFEHAITWAQQVVRDHRLPEQALHGDAGMGNVLSGGVWHDWEDSCRGPVIWDLASLVSTARITGRAPGRAEATLCAYGDAPGIDRIDQFVAIRGLQVLAWSLLASADEGQPRASTSRRLDWLRAHQWPN